MSAAATELLPTAAGPVEVLRTGRGEPVTVYLHGLGGGIADTRPFAGGVAGTAVIAHLAGHGRTPLPRGPDLLAGAVTQARALVAGVSATQALGVSFGARVVAGLLAEPGSPLMRAALVIPPADDPDRLRAMAAASGDAAATARLLRSELPGTVRDRPDVQAWVDRQAAVRTSPAVAELLASLTVGDGPAGVPEGLAACSAEVLVLAQRGDPAHSVETAERLAAAIPRSRLVVLDPGGLLWAHRRRVRELLTGILGAA